MDHRDFLKHFLGHQHRILAYLFTVTGNMHDAEDLLQEVSIVLWEKFAQYDSSRPFLSWALGIARIESLRWRRSQAKTPVLLPDECLWAVAEVMSELPAEEGDMVTVLRGCLSRLQKRTRRMVHFRYEEGMSLQAIADRIGATAGAVQMALQRARGALRECVERNLQPETGGRG